MTINSDKSGQALENLVALIETTLLPKGFKIDRRVKTWGTDGKQRSEYDIIIQGKAGTLNFKGLIECRDRPSEGSAPRRWIQELSGRRIDGKFDKVMAVSSTGFSSGAREAASTLDIELRSLSEATGDNISSWACPNAPLIQVKQLMKSVNIVVYPNKPNVGTKDKFYIEIDKAQFVNTVNELKCDIRKLWLLFAKDCAALIPQPSECPISMNTTVASPKEWISKFRIEWEGEQYAIHSLSFDVQIDVYQPTMPLVSAMTYRVESNEEQHSQSIADVATWQTQGSNSIDSITFIGYRKETTE